MSRPKMKIKKGDQVIVRAGSNKGQVGHVVKVLPREDKVFIENIRVVTRHMKPSQLNPEGKKSVHHPIHVSNVALVVPGTQQPTKIGYKVVDGKKVRVAKKTAAVID